VDDKASPAGDALPRRVLDFTTCVLTILLRCDTRWIDTDRGVCRVTWRGAIPLETAEGAEIHVSAERLRAGHRPLPTSRGPGVAGENLRHGATTRRMRILSANMAVRCIAAAKAIGAESIAVATGSYDVAALAAAGATYAVANLAAKGAIEALLG
jgi:hypothetical protein